eukprot:5800237-Pleurochrysis_carterae.AAC.3
MAHCACNGASPICWQRALAGLPVAVAVAVDVDVDVDVAAAGLQTAHASSAMRAMSSSPLTSETGGAAHMASRAARARQRLRSAAYGAPAVCGSAARAASPQARRALTRLEKSGSNSSGQPRRVSERWRRLPSLSPQPSRGSPCSPVAASQDASSRRSACGRNAAAQSSSSALVVNTPCTRPHDWRAARGATAEAQRKSASQKPWRRSWSPVREAHSSSARLSLGACHTASCFTRSHARLPSRCAQDAGGAVWLDGTWAASSVVSWPEQPTCW